MQCEQKAIVITTQCVLRNTSSSTAVFTHYCNAVQQNETRQIYYLWWVDDDDQVTV